MNALYDRGFSEFGGVADKAFSGFLPTGQTLNFILSANDPDERLKVMAILNPSHRLLAEQVLTLQSVDTNLPAWGGVLSLSNQWLHYFITGEKVRPELSTEFPAHPIASPLDWSNLILSYNVMAQIQEIKAWLTHGETLMHEWGLAKKVKPGYRALFYGPPGTGKTLTATLLAKSTCREIYRVDLSMIVSKYIGETEKIWRAYSMPPPIKTGFFSLMKLMLFSDSAQPQATPTTDTPINRPATCYNASKIFPAWLFLPATSSPIWMKPLLADSNQ